MISGHEIPKVDASLDDTALYICKVLLKIIFADYVGPVAIQLWNKEYILGDDNSECTIIFKKQYPLRRLFLHKDLTRLVDAYLRGDIDIDGNIEVLFSLIGYLKDKKFTLHDHVSLFRSYIKLAKNKNNVADCGLKPKNKKKSNCKDSIAHHYDVGNEFYRMFLDPEMVYSCAYFSDKDQPLADAQKDKLDYICRKLRLEPGEKLLDIGCGWGGLAIWAAQNYGVYVHGITLSCEQYNYATAKVKKLNLINKVNIELLDYRDLPDETIYDKIVSVGMFEHIGIINYPIYFNLIHRLLKPGGLFLNHGITNDTGWLKTPITQFMNKYIFPDGELARISDVITSMEDVGLEVLDTEALRPHYTMTLRHWIKTLIKNKSEAIEIVGEPTYRLWQLYMAGSAYYFNEGSTGIYQVLACRNRQSWSLPLRRDDLYLNLSDTSQKVVGG